MKTKLHSIAITLTACLAGTFALAEAKGDVLVAVNGNGNMVVVGEDGQNEFIYVEASVQDGRFTFFDPNGATTFNGLSVLTVNNVVGNMKFDLGSGEKVLILDDGPAADFEVFGDLEIKSDGNQSTIIIIDDADVEGKTKITTKNGQDAVVLIESDVNQISINTGNGDDLILALGGTADFNSSTQIKTGKGNDAVQFESAEFFGKFKLTMSSENDLAAFFGSSFYDTTEIDGNKDFDSFGQNNSWFATVPVLKSIEAPNANPATLVNQIALHPVYAVVVDLIP